MLEGVRVSAITIQKILTDNGLGTRVDRWLALEKANADKVNALTVDLDLWPTNIAGPRLAETGLMTGGGMRLSPFRGPITACFRISGGTGCHHHGPNALSAVRPKHCR